MNHDDDVAIRQHRLQRIRAQLRAQGHAAVLTVDPVNLRYATGSRNMQVWTMHNICRYALVFEHGPVVLFDLMTGRHLSAHLESITETRPSVAFDYMLVGTNAQAMALRWARDIVAVIEEHGARGESLAVDRADTLMVSALAEYNLRVVDGKSVFEHARSIKSTTEIRAFQASMTTCEASVRSLLDFVQPGMTETQAFGHLVGESIARGGEYPETRLLSSGARTNPWFQEASDRVINRGDLMSFDTDLIGPGGFYNDISRSWVIGEARHSREQATLLDVSKAQLAHNIALLMPGVSFLEFADKAFELPQKYLANRYADIAHGCGLGVEYPFVLYPEDADEGMYDGHFEANMVVCIESYVGALGGGQGVKLEQPVLITERGPEVLCALPVDASDF